ncbi:bifunctional folylpolyglutamate synthase/dihydrofolate synthase [Kangiella koreensis]|uniref:Dihydrofolate synthase/folylpolyglutamate synthase n=1 Tax=Kangiella koreensis (strain DSM 16069 / JCM 12317 / KCTC 12182 / SW-125) TaxID=523791 RepID=C7RCA3_KANKD|nr:folylpolyglutamate synthase/dihydrofolate synthase family protein [Kangiella koreensis]ACV26895.1 FolC bifunctional protein [Kangiella koreensis DSM 16069]
MIASPDFNTLNEWIAWLEQAHPIHEIELGLSRIQKVANSLGLLELNAPVITVAGTNGKGTVVATLESLAVEHDLSVASYTSPHLLAFNERVKHNGYPVSDDLLITAFRHIAQHQSDIPLTYFEFTTLVAFWIFKQQELDLIVLEVGLGGRMDAVNIINPDIAVITSIGLDHVDWLGDTLEKVAHEKAGIMRSDKPVIIADSQTQSLLLPEISARQAKGVVAQLDYQYEDRGSEWAFSSVNEGQELSINGLANNDLLVSNLASALQAFLLVFPAKVNPESIKRAYEHLQFIGRFQYLSKAPIVIVDVAHNPDSAKILNQKLEQLKERGVEHITAICGMLKDKDIAGSLAYCTAIDQWNCIDLPGQRGSKGEELLNKLPEKSQKDAKTYHLLVDALDEYWQHQHQNQALVVFGSFVTVAMMLETWPRFSNTILERLNK